MSLYESSILSSTWTLSKFSRRLSRRFTTLEGWREIGLGVYVMSSNIRMFSLNLQFDPEIFHQEPRRKSSEAVVPPVPKILPEEEWIRTSKDMAVKAIEGIRDEEVGEKGRSKEKDVSYHVYSRREKWNVIAIVGILGLFPGLTANIYLPTLNAVGRDFETGLDDVMLTVTSYYVAQGFASLLWEPLADSLGRRPVYIYSFLLYISANIVLSFSPNFAILVVFRAIQSFSIASTVSMGRIVMYDISLPSEHVRFYAFSQGIRNYTIIVAPIIGGLLAKYMSFRSIFVFLLGLSITALILLLLFLPETHRIIAGNGTWSLKGIHQPLIWRLKIFGKPAYADERQLAGTTAPIEAIVFIKPLMLLREKDILLSLLFSGVIFGIWSMVTISTAGLFQSVFGLNEAFLGLVFVPSGLGTIAGSTFMSNLLNRDFLTASSTYKTSRSLPQSTIISRSSLPASFPLEHARLVRLPMVTIIFVITLSFYGFTLSYSQLTSRPGWILVPLLLQFIITASVSCVCAIHHTLITDLWPKNEASGAAMDNLVKCLFAAVGVAVVQLFIKTMDVGPVFLALALVVLAVVPLPIVQWCWGEDWRRERDSRDTVEVEGAVMTEKV